jgi:hypothetical protein
MLTPEELARQIAEQEGRLKPAAPKPVDAAMARARQVGQARAVSPVAPVVDDDDWDAALNRIAAKHGVTPGSGVRTRKQQDDLIRGGRTLAENSYHLSTDRPRRGARDFGGKPENMLAFAREVDELYGKDLAELIHTPYRAPKNPVTRKAHYDHVHVAWGRPYAKTPEELAREIAETEGRAGKRAAAPAEEISPEDLARQIATTEGRARPTSTPATGLTPAMANRGVPMLPPIPGAGMAPGGPPAKGRMQTPREEVRIIPPEQAGPPRPTIPDPAGPRAYNPALRQPTRARQGWEHLGRGLQQALAPIATGRSDEQLTGWRRDVAAGKAPAFSILSARPEVAARQVQELSQLQNTLAQQVIQPRISRSGKLIETSTGEMRHAPDFRAAFQGMNAAAVRKELAKRGVKLTPFQQQNLAAALEFEARRPFAERDRAGNIALDVAVNVGAAAVGGKAAQSLAGPLSRIGNPIVQAAARLGTEGAVSGGIQQPLTRKLVDPNATPQDLAWEGFVGIGAGGFGGGALGAGGEALSRFLARPRLGAPQIPPRTAPLRPEATRTSAPPRPEGSLPVDRGTAGRFVSPGKGKPAARVPTLETATGSMRLTPGVEVEAPRLSGKVRFKVERVDEKGIVHLTAPNGTKAQAVKTELRAPETYAPVGPYRATGEKITPKPKAADPERLGLIKDEWRQVQAALDDLDAKAPTLTLKEWKDQAYFRSPSRGVMKWGSEYDRPLTRQEAHMLNQRRSRMLSDENLQEMPLAVAGEPPKTRLQMEFLDRDWAEGRASQHRDLVEQALADGKTVPPQVLADYPDLASKAPPAAPPPAPKARVAKPKTVAEPPPAATPTPKPVQPPAPTPRPALPPKPKPAPTPRVEAAPPAATGPGTIDKPTLDQLIGRVSTRGKLPRAELRKQLGQLTKNVEGDYDLTPQQVATLESMLKTAKYDQPTEDLIRAGWKTPAPGSSTEAFVRYRKEERARAAAAKAEALPQPAAAVGRVPKTAPEPPKSAQPKPRKGELVTAPRTSTELPEGDLSSVPEAQLQNATARLRREGASYEARLEKLEAELDAAKTVEQETAIAARIDALETEWGALDAQVGRAETELLRRRKPDAPITELSEGGLNARGSKAPPTRPRIEPAPLPGGSTKRLAEIVTDLGAAVNKRIQIGTPSRGARGTYYPGSTKTVIRNSGNLSTTAHEIGHVLDDRFGLVKPWNQKRVRSPFDAELLPHFSQHGSPMSTLAGKRLEAVAEFTRAYILNPAEAKKQAPAFFAHFEREVPADIRRALISSGVEIRKLQGMPATDRLLANVRMEPTKVPLKEQAQTAVRGTGTGFETTKVDQLRAMVLDDLDPIMRGIARAEELQGKQAPLPSDDPALLIRLHAGVNGKIQNVFERGMVDTQGKRIASLEGGFAKLLEPLDRSTEATLRREQAEVVAYMIAQRTKHVGQKAKAAGGSLYAPTVTGAGGGLEPDVLQAEKVIGEHLARPAAHRARIEAAAKLYREWSDSLLDYLAESGRYSKEAVQAIRDENPYYVDLHRVLGEDTSVPGRPAAGSGKKLGSASQVIQQFKGSAKTIDNPYANLMEQTARAIKEADRNVAMRKFRDLLVNPRGIHQGKPIDLSAIGNRVPASSTEPNLITIYVDGKAEKWKFDDGIYQALQNWGRIPTDWFPTYLASFTRAAITHSPAFAIRNFIRDTIERKVSSPVDSGLRDLAAGVTQVGRDDLQLAGGSQAGHYLKDKLNYHREQTKIIRKLAQDKNMLVVGLQDLGRVAVELGEKSEQANRLAEYNAALKYATDRLGYGERDAQLYAANKARELIDFAQAGALVREINRYVPFTNAQVQGLRRSVRLMKERPAVFVAKWAGYVVAPTLAVYAYNQAAGTMKEYQQLPTYQRDLFWNFKAGDRWISIPKPHELGVLASGVERTLDRAFGNKRAFEGYSGTLSKQLMPVEDVPILGGVGPLVEAKANRDLFRDRPIVPQHEAGRALELREGTKNASRIGQALQSVIKQDARSIDFVIRGMTGGLGDLTLRASDIGKPDSLRGTGEAALGLTKRPPLYNARDVQYDLKRAEELNRGSDPRVKNLIRMLRRAADAKGAEKARREEQARDFATRLRGSLERMKPKQPRR